jgi:hypothetical protein
MKTILLMNLIIGYLTLTSALLIGLSLMTLKYFPTSKVSGWVRRNLITDEDLEPINDEGSEPLKGNESQSPSEGTNS